MSDDLWPELRGPHLPDTLMRIPLGVWPFLALAVLAAYGRWLVVTSNGIEHPVDLLWAVPTTVQHVGAPLLGAALFYRHPYAHRTLPSVALAAILFAFTTVADALREPVMNGIASPPTLGSLDDSMVILAGTGYAAVEALLGAFALTYLAIGLSDARWFEDAGRSRVAAGILIAAAFGSTAVNTVLAWQWAGDLVVPNLVAVGAQLVVNLAWVYFGWTALRGWQAGEGPGRAWALAALAGIGYLALASIGTLLSVILWFIGPTESPVPLIYEVAQLLGAAFAGLWLALLAAFWLGLPAEVEPGVEDPPAHA